MSGYTSYADYMAQTSKWGGYANSEPRYDIALTVAQKRIDNMKANHEREENWAQQASANGYSYKECPVHVQDGKTMHNMKIVGKLSHIRRVMLDLLARSRPHAKGEIEEQRKRFAQMRSSAAHQFLQNVSGETNMSEIFMLEDDARKLAEGEKDEKVEKGEKGKALGHSGFSGLLGGMENMRGRANFGGIAALGAMDNVSSQHNLEEYFPRYEEIKLDGVGKEETKSNLDDQRCQILQRFDHSGIGPRSEAIAIKKYEEYVPESLSVLNLEDKLIYDLKTVAARSFTDKDKSLPQLGDLLAQASSGQHEFAYKSFEGYKDPDVVLTVQIDTKPADNIGPKILNNIANAVLADRDKFNYCNETDLASAWKTWEDSKSADQWLEFERDAKAWGAREQKLINFLNEKDTPITITPNGKEVKDDDFGATSLATAGGFIGVIMEKALTSGDTKTGFIHTLKKGLAFKYKITPAKGTGESPKNFMGSVGEDSSTDAEASCTDEYSRTSYARYSNGESYKKKGTCKVSIKYDSTSSWAKENFDQYDKLDGKELMPVTYRDQLIANQ